MAPGACTVNINGSIGVPFTVARRVLGEEPCKSLASFGSGLSPHRRTQEETDLTSSPVIESAAGVGMRGGADLST